VAKRINAGGRSRPNRDSTPWRNVCSRVSQIQLISIIRAIPCASCSLRSIRKKLANPEIKPNAASSPGWRWAKLISRNSRVLRACMVPGWQEEMASRPHHAPPVHHESDRCVDWHVLAWQGVAQDSPDNLGKLAEQRATVVVHAVALADRPHFHR